MTNLDQDLTRARGRTVCALASFRWVIPIAITGSISIMAGQPAAAASRTENAGPVRAPFFGIHVVDERTGQGIPLVELRTVNEIRYLTDNAGWIAFLEPGLMEREVFWHVSGPGLDVAKDGFGYAGFRATAKAGQSVVYKVKRSTIAQRLGRLTGQGLYRDSELLGRPTPVPNILEPGISGQDSVQCVPYQGKLFWLWGDTGIPRYPLGNFHTTCARTPTNAHPEQGLRFEYFTDPDKPDTLRRMMPTKERGVVWMFGLASLKDERGEDRLFAGFSRRPGLTAADELGVAEFDAAAGVFRKVADVPKADEDRIPRGHAVRAVTADGDHFYFCAPYAMSRVPATAAGFRDPSQFEFLRFDDFMGEWQWRWQKAKSPTTVRDEAALLKSGRMKPGQARYQMVNATNDAGVVMHGASIQWNAWRRRYVLIGVEAGPKEAPSYLGEVWYAECDAITGPWRQAVKVATHPRYSYYNPVHHVFFDTEGGRLIYFEGTYTKEFSGNPTATPRYDYNQLMYRLDLGDERLKPAQARE